MKKLIVLIITVVVALGAIVMFRNKSIAPNTQEVQQTDSTKPAPHFGWEFEDVGADDTGIPATNVTLSTETKQYKLGKQPGTCFTIEGSNWQFLENEKSGAICWFAGAGVEFGVFKEGETYILKSGPLEEPSEESPGIRGNFTVITTIQ